MEVKDMTEQQVKEKLEALMRKYGVMDIYVYDWIKHPFDISNGLCMRVDGNFEEFREEVCDRLSDYDNDICTAMGTIPSIGNPRRDNVLQRMKPIYKDGKCLC